MSKPRAFAVKHAVDRDGTTFTAFWWDENFHLGPQLRGQVFHAELLVSWPTSDRFPWVQFVADERTAREMALKMKGTSPARLPASR